MGQEAFPQGFVWRAAPATYQLDGAVAEDGRGESNWARFSHTPGTVAGDATGDVACDHYHRWPEDIALMGELGLAAYRFSIAWPRIQPTGRGLANPAGLDFYDRLVDGILEAGIDPVITLYHWDLPQALEDTGGWRSRDTAEAFAAYAGIVAARLGDRVRTIATLNEPWVSSTLGYLDGIHAPGRTSQSEALAAAHHLLLAHGLGVQAVRAETPGADVGIVLNFEPKHPALDHPLDLAEAEIAHALMNRWYLDPLSGRGYPEPGVAATGWDQSEVAAGDLDVIAQPLDFLGVNYYSREVVRSPQLPADEPGLLRKGDRRTAMDWEVYPSGLTEILDWIWEDYGIGPLYVTENGAAFRDEGTSPPFDDEDRRTYLADHLAAARNALAHGVPLAGYFVWSLLDNFEWAWGYDQRFGIVHVDYDTQQRTIRQSGRWYADVIAANALPER
jgi:beta-glucosidase